jgi:phage gpG-like protein
MASDPIQARGVDRTARHFHELGKRARNPKDASYKIRTIFRQAEAGLFDSQGHHTWPKLADATKAAKQRGGDPRMMRATNALYKSLTAVRASGQVDERKPDELRFGTEIPYAGFHERGAGVPKRALINLTRAETHRIRDALAEYIATGDKT